MNLCGKTLIKQDRFIQNLEENLCNRIQTIRVTVAQLLISKTGFYRCLQFRVTLLNCLLWQSRPAKSRHRSVQLHEWMSIDLFCEPFSRSGSFVRKHGDLRGERKVGEATHAVFFSRSSPYFFIIILFLYFFLFRDISFFFFFIVVPKTLYFCFALQWWISNYFIVRI